MHSFRKVRGCGGQGNDDVPLACKPRDSWLHLRRTMLKTQAQLSPRVQGSLTTDLIAVLTENLTSNEQEGLHLKQEVHWCF